MDGLGALLCPFPRYPGPYLQGAWVEFSPVLIAVLKRCSAPADLLSVASGIDDMRAKLLLADDFTINSIQLLGEYAAVLRGAMYRAKTFAFAGVRFVWGMRSTVSPEGDLGLIAIRCVQVLLSRCAGAGLGDLGRMRWVSQLAMEICGELLTRVPVGVYDVFSPSAVLQLRFWVQALWSWTSASCELTPASVRGVADLMGRLQLDEAAYLSYLSLALDVSLSMNDDRRRAAALAVSLRVLRKDARSRELRGLFRRVDDWIDPVLRGLKDVPPREHISRDDGFIPPLLPVGVRERVTFVVPPPLLFGLVSSAVPRAGAD